MHSLRALFHKASDVVVAGNFIADENGSENPLKRYQDKTLVIVLPGDLTVFDIGEEEAMAT